MDICAICLNELHSRAYMKFPAPGCIHLYHNDCLEHLYALFNTCPQCKRKKAEEPYTEIEKHHLRILTDCIQDNASRIREYAIEHKISATTLLYKYRLHEMCINNNRIDILVMLAVEMKALTAPLVPYARQIIDYGDTQLMKLMYKNHRWYFTVVKPELGKLLK